MVHIIIVMQDIASVDRLLAGKEEPLLVLRSGDLNLIEQGIPERKASIVNVVAGCRMTGKDNSNPVNIIVVIAIIILISGMSLDGGVGIGFTIVSVVLFIVAIVMSLTGKGGSKP